MAKDTLLSVIEELLEADQNAVNKKNFKTEQEKQKTSPDTQGVLGKKGGAALDAGGDKDVGGKKGENASDASPAVEADKGPHKQDGDEFETKSKLGEADEPTNKKNFVKDQPALKTSPKAEADKEVNATDLKDEGGKKPVEEEADEEETMAEGELPPALKKANAKKDDEESDEGEEEEGDEEEEGEEEDDEEESEDDGEEEEGDEEEEDPEEEPEDDDTDEVKEESDGKKPEWLVKKMKAAAAKAKGEDPEEAVKEAEELTDKQKELDVNGDGKIGADDLKALRDGKKKGDDVKEEEEMEEEEGLEEDFKEKATIIFETAVNHKAQMIREEIEAEYKTKLSEEVEQMNAKISEFVDYAVQEWLKENQLEIKYSLRTEIAENFIKGLKNLFTESYIEIPEDDVSVVDELTEAVESYKEQIEEQSAALEEAQQELLSLKRASIVDELAEDLTETQKIRLEKLSESVEAGDIDEFRYKVDQLKESFFSGESEQNPLLGSLSEEVFGGTQSLEEDTSVVSQYAKFLSKTVLK